MSLRIVNARTAEQWAEIIQAKWQDGVKGALDVGLSLHNSRDELGKTKFWKMVRERLRYADSTVRQLIQIGTDVNLMSVALATLPANWTTLYRLSCLTEEEFQRGIDTGVIHAGMERKDVALLKPPKEKRRQKPLADFPVEHPINGIATEIRTSVYGWLNELPFDEWQPLVERLRAEIKYIEDDFPAIEAEMREEGKAA